MNLTLSDLFILIPLLEQALDTLHKEIDSEDEKISVAAAELSVIYANTAANLEDLYRSLYREGCNYPNYEMLISRG
ncbi:hypothetical protein ACJJIF_12515 [Microbulbifer sp. SSSA002]|uniref:hypothetical protein n=1 Tax=unclassified Microbulbifer TaxID=2619833 RepID=UPI004039B402